MYEDKILYWAWRGKEPPKIPPPTKKRVEYAEIIGPGRHLNGPQYGALIVQKLACGVWDDDRYTPLNRGDGLCELEWHRKYGSEILMPSNAALSGWPGKDETETEK